MSKAYKVINHLIQLLALNSNSFSSPLHRYIAVTIADKRPNKNKNANITSTPVSHFLAVDSNRAKSEIHSLLLSLQ